MDLFAHTSLCFILSLVFPFNTELLREFFANLCINHTFTALTSYVNRCPVEIIYQDCVELLQLSTTREKMHLIASDPDFDLSTANHFLRQTNAPFHIGEKSSLVKDARTIQHVFRTSIIPKAGDQIHITPLPSLITFYIMAHREINTADLIFRYIDHLTTIRDPGHKRKPNLALGHLIAYVLETKYQLQYPIPPNLPTLFYSNSSFSTLHSTHLHPGDEEPRGAEEEDAPSPVLDPVPFHQHLPFDQNRRSDEQMKPDQDCVSLRMSHSVRCFSVIEFICNVQETDAK
ncbi:hypothetical protein MA16_Dca023540 [Dendrobium catenatum]|uniref:Uncharacterized protein n=1 Tax=Dendrobium catenatum TaxID=906689 RepID=A0A2I0VHF6_9ASPA|nr:hypothetical protein MA16_Dca023540 [Dendrobium catenatum]